MAFNGSGTFSRIYNWVTDRTNGIKVRADRMDDELDGIAAGLSNAICKDGQTTVTADIPFANHKLTVVGDATEATDALNRQSGDTRYLKRPSTLTPVTDLADGDIFGVYDLSAVGGAGATWANIKANILAEMTTSFFPTGTRLAFQQTTPPTGWTKETSSTYNDIAVRLTTGTVTTGGSAGFAATFDNRTLTGTVGSSTLSEAQLASHDHTYTRYGTTANIAGTDNFVIPGGTSTQNTGTAGSGSFHTHTLTMNSASFDVKFADFVIGTKA